MGGKVLQVIEGMGVLIALYLLVQNAEGFGQVVKAVGAVTTDQTKALQGR